MTTFPMLVEKIAELLKGYVIRTYDLPDKIGKDYCFTNKDCTTFRLTYHNNSNIAYLSCTVKCEDKDSSNILRYELESEGIEYCSVQVAVSTGGINVLRHGAVIRFNRDTISDTFVIGALDRLSRCVLNRTPKTIKISNTKPVEMRLMC